MLLLLACTTAEPEVDPRLLPLQESLRLYDEGLVALEHDPVKAAELFAQASEQDPRSAILHLWRAQALADAGDLEGAIAEAGTALGLDQNLVAARYNRACWRTRAGDLEGGREDLLEALMDVRIDPLSAALDPDLAPLLEAYPELPRAELPCTATVPGEAVFVGSDWTLVLECRHRPTEPLSIEGPALPGALRHVRTVQTVAPDGPLQRSTLELTFSVQGAQEQPLGPWTFSSGVLQGHAPASPTRFLAPEGHAPPEPVPSQPWQVPTTLFPEEGIRREGPRVLVRAQPGDRVGWEATEVVRYELRRQGALEWVAWSGELSPDQELTLSRGKTEVYRGQQP